jgi:hypothetical protein
MGAPEGLATMQKFPPIIDQLESYRAARLQQEVAPVDKDLARRMGLSVRDLKALIEAGEIQTIQVGRRCGVAVEEREAQRWLEARGGCLLPQRAPRAPLGAGHKV